MSSIKYISAQGIYTVLLFSIEISSDDGSDDNNGVIIALAILLAIAVIGLVISVVINVIQRKQSRCVVTSIHCM